MKKKIAELINILFGMRKFVLMVVLYLIGIVFRVKGLVSGAEMVDLFKTTTIAFMGANGVEHVVGTVKEVMGKAKAPKQLADTNESDDEEEVEPVVEG